MNLSKQAYSNKCTLSILSLRINFLYFHRYSARLNQFLLKWIFVDCNCIFAHLSFLFIDNIFVKNMHKFATNVYSFLAVCNFISNGFKFGFHLRFFVAIIEK
ncbi:hypothetical protein BpHYR1_017298 [Brachionus plicatilis]|uniref:Uncharacterized protein n=1 Tax=Brachionus plicatilis TaxID=10195 RepID=A0A3M7R4H1_BRAPC|nr:hypothetical protein BpHYR1_017298 [Brachionus plicatilis]